MSCKAIENGSRRHGLSRVWKVYCYAEAVVALQLPSDLWQCFLAIIHEMWKEVIRGNMTYEDFELLQVIGRGSYGKVLKVRDKMDKKIYAMKCFTKSNLSHRSGSYTCFGARSGDSVLDTFSRQMYQYELLKLDCPFLCKHHAFFQTEDKYFTILDYIPCGELFYQLAKEKRFSEDRCRFYTAQLVVAVEYLHKNGIILREIKPENVMMSAEGNIVLTDFFLFQDKSSLELDRDRFTTWSGTPEYLSPEILRGEQCTKAVDYWGIGILVFEMLTGLPPFYREDVQEMYMRIMTAEIFFPDFVSGPVRDFIRKLLERDVKLRTEYGEKMRSHEWFGPIDFHLLGELKIIPPFVPPLRCEDSINCYIDAHFLDPAWDDRTDTIVNAADFSDFIYVPNDQ